MADTRSLHQTRFEAAVSVIQSLPKNGSFQPSQEMMLKFYSFYKQATQGPCNAPKPAFWDPVGRYKWDAWSSLGDMSKEDAMIAYVDEMKKIIETMPMTEKVEELLRVIGPFYEIVEDQKHSLGSGVTSVRLDKVTKSLEDLSNVLTSTPNCKAVNGKAESSDSGAESEDEEPAQHENGEAEEGNDEEESEQEEKSTEQDSVSPSSPEITISPDIKTNVNCITEIGNHISNKSALNRVCRDVNINEEQLFTEDVNTLERDKEYDGTDDIAAVQHLTSDSDSEIFCDSMEQFGQEEVDHSALLEDALLNEDPVKTTDGGEKKDGGEDVRPTGHLSQRERSGHEKSEYVGSRRGRVGRMHPVGEGSRGGQMGSGGDEERWRSLNSSLNEQIAVILMRLQEDMQNVLQRLHALETVTASQARSLALQSNYKQTVNKSPSWWPFDLSPGNLAFAIIWPFVAQWLIHVYLQRKRRKPT